MNIFNFQNLGRKSNDDTASDEDRIDLTMAALDTNQDKKADPWELLCWVQWVEEVFQGVKYFVNHSKNMIILRINYFKSTVIT